MESSRKSETIELSEAIRAILGDENSPLGKASACTSRVATPRNKSSSDALFSPKQPDDREGRKCPSGRGGATLRKHPETPVSRKSSLLQRSLGSDYKEELSFSQRKRRHAHEVIILRPPKKRMSGSTPRVTSTSKLTPNATSATQSRQTSETPTRRHPLQSTPVSSICNSLKLRRDTRDSNNGSKAKREDILSKSLESIIPMTSDLSAGPGRRFLKVVEEEEGLSETDLQTLQAQFLSIMQQEQAAGSSGSPGVMDLLQGGGGALDLEQLRTGGLSLKVNDQTNRISLIAKGNQDDSLTNITWLRRMSAPDLDPVTLQQIKAQEAQKERPPYSYSSLIQFAISSAPEGKMTLRDIYFWIETSFPYFRTAKLGWKNSIRHNLSLHKIFIREAPAGPGQPAYWTLRPGTIVRLPERKVVVHDAQDALTREGVMAGMLPMNSFQTKAGPSLAPLNGNGVTCMMSDPSNLALSGQEGAVLSGGSVFTSTPVLTRPASKGSKRPILPKGTPPYALVPLPIYFTTDPKTGQLVPASGDNTAPHLSPLLPAGPTIGQKTTRLPDLTTPPPKISRTTMEQSMPALGGTTMDSGYASANLSLGDDAGAISQRGSLPVKNLVKAKRVEEKENSLSAEFELGLDVQDDLLKTPPKTVCPEWLSPIRYFTPGRDSSFSMKDVDLNFTPFRTGFTPNNKMEHANTPRHLMLSPDSTNLPFSSAGGRSGRKARMMTPRRYTDPSSVGANLHNSSFEQMFGDVNFDVDPDSIDVGNMSWLLQSPPPAKH